MHFPEDVPTLSDGVVTLRAHTIDDVPRVVEQCNDPESIRWTTVPQPYADQDAVEWIGTVIPKGWTDRVTLIFAIEYAGRFGGSVDLRLRGGGEAEIGYGLHPDARGHGVARRALTLLLDWAFLERGVTVVSWRANRGNWASRRVAWRLGFRFGPTLPRLLDQRGESRDGWTAWLAADDPLEPRTPWLEPTPIDTARLHLRPWTESDGNRLVKAAYDPHLREGIPRSPLPVHPAEVPTYLLGIGELAATGQRVAWCVADRATDDALGSIALAPTDLDGDTAQVGYWSHPSGRGRGLMTEGLRAVADHAFRPAPGGLGLRRLFLLTAADNTPSRRLAERSGFHHVGTERAAAPKAGGTWADNALYDRLMDDPAPGG